MAFLNEEGLSHFLEKLKEIFVVKDEDSGGSISWEDIYPIGAVYISHTSTSPAELFGGEWTRINGYFLYAGDGTGTGGSNNITLTTSQIPSHKHNLGSYNGNIASGSNYTTIVFNNTNTTPDHYTNAAGGSQAHSNIPSYKTLYVWYRTA